MSASALAILLTLVVYQVLLVGIGLWAGGRTHTTADFYLGGRRLGGLVAAISASASSSSAWTLLGVSGAAYTLGLPALWLFPATVSGFALNWLWVAPRLRRLSAGEGSITLTEVLAGDPGHALHLAILRLASFIILFSFIFYIAAQFAAAGETFAGTFGLSPTGSILLGGGIIVLYTLLGGFWAASVTDTVQGLLMAATAVVLPAVALAAIGGPAALLESLRSTGGAAGSLTGQTTVWAGLAFVLGTLGIGLGYPGQPHVVNRFMALRDARALRQGRAIALAWAVVIYAGMLLLGWSGRVLFPVAGADEQVFFHVAADLLPPVISGVMIAAVLSAVMSTADSQLLVAASSVTHDLRPAGRRRDESLAQSRLVVLALSLLAIAAALFVPDDIFSRVLFAWHALGSAFGPPLVLRLAGYRLRQGATLGAMAAGFGLTVVFHFLPAAPGGIMERVVPLLLSLAIAWQGRSRSAAPGGKEEEAA